MTLHVRGRGLWLIAALVVVPLASARAAPVLAVNEPSPGQPAGKYALQVQEDGTAALHLQWAANDAKPHAVDLALSTFTAAGKPAVIVGFDAGQPAVLPYLKDATVPAAGAVLRLVASGLEPGVSYAGTLTAMVSRSDTAGGGPQPVTWDLVLIRPGAVPLFRCPDPAQTVRLDDSIVFDVPRTTPPRPLTVGLRLAQFLSPDSERGDVGFASGPGGTQLADELRSVPVPGDHLTVALRARGLGEGVAYSGKLTLVSGGGDALDCPISIAMPKLPRGELVADRQSFTTTVTAPWLGTASVSLSLRLFEKSRARPLYGITVALDGSAESPDGGFDLDRNMAFEVNGHPAARLTRLPPEDLRDPTRAIAPGGQIEVQLVLHDLKVGKHALALRFNAVNATGPSQRIELVVNVRHGWPWAMLALVVALLLSFVLTRTIVGWRKRLRLRIRIDQLRDQSFVEHSNLAIAVFLRVVLDQTEEMLERYTVLPPPDSVDDYITRAERTARILACYSTAVGALRATRCADRIKRYYRDAIVEAIHRVGPAPLDQATTDAVVDQLASIEKGLAEPFPSYWANITGRGRILAQQLHDVRQTLRALAQLDKLVEALGHPEQLADPRPDDLRVAAYDRLYWFGRLLYARRDDPSHLDQMAQHCRPCQDHDDFLDVDLDGLLRDADRRAWEQLKAEVPGRVQIQEVQPGPGAEALHPLRFQLRFDNRALADSYFVNNVLVYEWEFEFTPDKRVRRMPRIDSPVRVNQPRVTMYVPAAGKLTVRARIFWPAASLTEPPLELDRKEFLVAPNQDLRLLGRLEASTVVHFALTAGVAVVTGLPALYFDNATFGSYADYVKILVWGVGIDQGKNLIQLVREVPPDGPPAT
ncbi:MAG TPA: hypothetical protein VHT91_44255 [Kofleriaceae bacterium]|nr:hypothetical protein [Kofleriaceae bacterium]